MMNIYFIQRLTGVHYVLVVAAIITSLITMVYVVDYIASWVSQKPVSEKDKAFCHNEKKFLLVAVPVSIWFTLLAIFVPTTDEYIALKWAKAYEFRHVMVSHEHNCTMPSDSDKSFIRALIKKGNNINNYQSFKSAHNEK